MRDVIIVKWSQTPTGQLSSISQSGPEARQAPGPPRASWWKNAGIACLLCVAAAIASPAQTFKVLTSFNGNDGSEPNGFLLQGTDGNFYGTTSQGGMLHLCSGGCGVVFKITPTGALTALYKFDFGGVPGIHPMAGLVLGTDGMFYGTTSAGGANHVGAVFKTTPAGVLTTLHTFDRADGANPDEPLVQGTDRNFYGTTSAGGPNGGGTVFKITPSGTLTVLYGFCVQANCADGGAPSGLVQGTDGNFYGTTDVGGANNDGTVFKITPAGVLTTLHSFDGTDGSQPTTALIQGTNGNFYGTTRIGGANNDGTVFKITPAGVLTVLHSFDGADGVNLLAGLVQGTDGNFYGETYGGGANDEGTIFKITAAGALTVLHSFNGTDGRGPYGGLVQGTDGTFYGTTFSGVVFSLNVGLAPFVRTVPTSGKVGTAVKILGNNLKGTTSVSFNGTPATFVVVSGTLINTMVPVGATTGKVKVVTPSRTLMSNVAFRVTQ